MGPKANGSALLSALFLMTLVAIAATAMSTRLQLDIYRTRLFIQSDRLALASQAVGFWAMARLSDPQKKLLLLGDKGRVLDYPTSLKSLYPGVSLQGSVYDLQARFNLNNLTNKAFQPILLRLLMNNVNKTDMKTLKFIVGATENWVSPYQLDRGQDALMTYYSQQKPPYLPGYQPMLSVSEFRTVAGVSADIYQSLLPLLTALPTVTMINLNTASMPVLRALGNGLTREQAEAIIELRLEKEQLDSGDLQLIANKYAIPIQQISIQSEYYLSEAIVKSSDLMLKHYMVLHRVKDRTGTYTISILSETLNTF